MEERTTGGSSKDKKYVLYTVVGDDRPRATAGGLLTRVLLCCLLVVALAVVPYVSLRLAQANTRTLVVYQPVPLHNRNSSRRVSHHRPVKQVQLMQVADLKLDNATASFDNESTTVPTDDVSSINQTDAPTVAPNLTTILSNATTLEPKELNATTVSSSNVEGDNYTATEPSTDIPSSTLGPSIVDTSTSTVTSNDTPAITTTEQVTSKIVLNKTSTSTPSTTETSSVSMTKSSTTTTKPSTAKLAETTISVTKASETTTTKIEDRINQSITQTKMAIDDGSTVTTTKPTTVKPSLPTVILESPPAPLKLAYVATSASGNHVGGICVIKDGNNVTDWSYFYENIPIELQSDHANGDHELRAMLAAVRTWAPLWQMKHVVVRSPHASIKESNLLLRQYIINDLNTRADGQFTYELEWRLPQGDELVKVSNSLAHLHQDYKYWFTDFKNRMDELLGTQNWETSTQDKHIKIKQESFFDDSAVENTSESPDHPVSLEQATILEKSALSRAANSLPHKLVYVATSASGNHVGGFCMWKIGGNITDWSYFYDNIPVELQSSHDSEDHEVRAALAGLRVWANRWNGTHVSLRSQRSPLLSSETSSFFMETLQGFASSAGFSYDLEWQLRKSDELMRISYSLSRLYRNFGHWFAAFKASIDDVAGPQDWNVATKTKRIHLNDEHFFIENSVPEVQPTESTKIE